MRSLNIAATGMLAQQLNVEVISNNIANMNTTGFKKRRVEFQDLIYQNMVPVGSTSSDIGTIVPAGVQVGLGVRPAAVYRISEQGNMSPTQNPLDLAVSGEGYFQVELPSGETAYTRAGSFQLSADGELVTADGYRVQPSIVIPEDATDIAVNSSGEVLVLLDGQVDPQNVGQLQLSNFPNEAGLESIGNNFFLETPASGAASTSTPASAGYGTILQGFLETSNVNVVEEITNLINAQRAYEMNSKVIQASDEMMAQMNQIR